MKFKKPSKHLATGLLCLGIIGIVGVGSYSYFSDGGNMVNEITTGSLDLETSETDWNPTGDQDGKNLYPGYTTNKNPTVKNITGILDNNAYIRATITFLDKNGNRITGNKTRCDLIWNTIRWDTNNSLAEGSKYTTAKVNTLPNFNPAFEYIAAKSDPNNGVRVFYLRNTLASAATTGGGESVTLFNRIVFPTEWSQQELDVMGDYKIDVKFEGIQEKTFDNVNDAMSALDNQNPKHMDYNKGDFKNY